MRELRMLRSQVVNLGLLLPPSEAGQAPPKQGGTEGGGLQGRSPGRLLAWLGRALAGCSPAGRHPSLPSLLPPLATPRGLYDPEVLRADDTDSEAQLRKQKPLLLLLLPPPPQPSPPGTRKALRAQSGRFFPALGKTARRLQRRRRRGRRRRRRRVLLDSRPDVLLLAGAAAPLPPATPGRGVGEPAARPRLGNSLPSPASAQLEGHCRAQGMEKRGKRMDCPALPPGWKKEEVIRKSGLSAGKSDVYYFSPSGKKFRSKPQLARYLGNTVDLSSFDFRTGKMMPSKLQKNKQRLRNDSLNQNKGKPDLNTTLPIRQTASIFKQPVTKVTNHPNNKVKSDPQRVIEQPRQLFWEKRLQGLSASDVSEQIIKSMELPKGLQGVGPGNNDDTLLSAVASALHTSSAPITGQLSAAVEKNPAVWLNTSQPLCKAFIVTDEDIRKQEERVQQVRKKLEEALMADILSRAADTTSLDEIEMDDGEEA